jgi:hypothetical protein
MLQLLAPFAPLLSRRVWRHALVLVAGTILAPGKRTVCAALRAMGLSQTKRWSCYHRVLNRARWSSLAVARALLGLLVAAFAPVGPLVFGLDETIARRWGAKIAARGLYRDAVRSSRTTSSRCAACAGCACCCWCRYRGRRGSAIGAA